MATSYTVKAIPTVSALGEAPHWDISRQSLYYIDLMAKKGIVLRYDLISNKTYKAVIGKNRLLIKCDKLMPNNDEQHDFR